jgi:hypothetical protein
VVSRRLSNVVVTALSCAPVAGSPKSGGGVILDQAQKPFPHQFGDQIPCGAAAKQLSHSMVAESGMGMVWC